VINIEASQKNPQLYLDSIEKIEREIIHSTITSLNTMINLLTYDNMQEN
jgi:hypothetical protein